MTATQRPLAPTKLESAATTEALASGWAGGAGAACIFVVDDQPANIQIAGSTLGNLGYEIVPAADGATVLKRLAVRTPDLILLDLLMPGMDGLEVCRQIKSNASWKDIPIIFLSAADDKELVVRALNTGGVDFITKPFNHAELVSRVRTQLALKTTRDRLSQIAEDKDELLGILAHDLKNFLGGINTSAELLSRQIARFDDERMTKLSENILRSSGQSLAFLKEYLANAATDRSFSLESGEVNLVATAAGAVEQYQEAARQKNIKIHGDFPAETAVVLADVSALRQVLDNLLSNALKFSPHGRRVFVSVRLADQYAECVIRDEGPGFTAEDKELMFRRYGRLSARPTGGEPSTGLGLSIVHKLVKAMNGELVCVSNPGQGAAFIFRLPVSGR
jgi:two-component system, sensor histidine kinase and response regulator